jgi:hypothetical protein
MIYYHINILCSHEHLRSKIKDQRSEIKDQKSKIKNQRSKSRDQRSKTKDQKQLKIDKYIHNNTISNNINIFNTFNNKQIQVN